MSDVWEQVLGAVVGTVFTAISGALATWLWKSYKHIRGIIVAAENMLVEQKKTNKLLGDALIELDHHDNQLGDHEVRIGSLEEIMQRNEKKQ